MYFPQDDHYEFEDDWYEFIRESVGTFTTTPTGTIIMYAANVLSGNADSDDTYNLFPNALDITDPFLAYIAADATETIIELTFIDAVDTLFLTNINFDTYTVTVNAISDGATSFQNTMTGIYSGITTLDSPGSNVFTITIPAQTPNDGESEFSIGAILGGSRNLLTPRYEAGRQAVEPVTRLQFDNNNKEIYPQGRKYQILNIDFSKIESADRDTLREIMYAVGTDGVCLVYENYSDRETGIIAEIMGQFPESETSVNRHNNVLQLKEKI